MQGLNLLLLGVIATACAEVNVVVDLSHWNGNVNFGTAKQHGLVGVIHKATQGVTYTDPKYGINQGLAEKVGLLWGAYHFGVGGKSGATQANHFLRTAGDKNKVLLVLDLETNHAGKSMSVAEAEEFVKTVKERTGRYPILYGDSNFLQNYNTPTLKKCPLWIAHYTTRNSPQLPTGWNSWVLWQYTDGKRGATPHTIPGIGTCDRNKYSGNLEQLKSKWPNL